MRFEDLTDVAGGPVAPAVAGCPIAGGSAVDVADGLFDLTDAELDERLRAVELHRRQLDAEFALIAGMVQRRRLYAADGHRSMKGYLRATCNWSNADVAQQRRHLAGTAVIPGLADTWHSGRLSRSQVDAICRAWSNPRIRHRVVEHADLLIELAATMSFDEFTDALNLYVLLADPDGTEQHHLDNIDGRDVHVIDANGLLHLSGRGGDPIVNAELAQIFREFCDHEFRTDTANRNADGSLPRTGAQRRYDAFVQAMRRAHATLTGRDIDNGDTEPANQQAAPSNSLPEPAESRARMVMNLVMSEQIMAAALAAMGLTPTDAAGRPLDPFTGTPVVPLKYLLDELAPDPDQFAALRCETGDGTVVHPVRLLQAALAGHMRRVVIGTRGVVLDMGRNARVFTGAAREAVMLLTRRCDHPGCDMPADWCQADHTTEWSQHGHTDQDNGRPQCGPHNRWKHEQKATIAFDTHGRPHTLRADGTPITPVGADPPTLANPPPAQIASRVVLLRAIKPLDPDARRRRVDAAMRRRGWIVHRCPST